MPYRKTKDNRLVNEITLGDGYPLSYNLKPLKVGGKTSPLEMSSAYPDDSVKAKVKVVGDLEVTGSIKGTTTADITGVTLTADDANIASDTEGSADFTIAGGEGIDTSVSGTTVTIAGENAGTANKGLVELATTAETTTGTDTSRVVTPDGLKDGYEGSSNIETVGDLDAGAITSGFGAINNGASSIATTGQITGGTVIGDNIIRGNGTLLVTSPTLTSADSDDYSIYSSQVLNDGSVAIGTQTYAQIKTALTLTADGGWDSVNLIDQQVGGASKFRVNKSGGGTFASTVTSSNGISGLWCASGNSNVSYRGNTVDYWYVGNQSLGDAITNGDFGTYKFSSAMFTAQHSAQLQGWNLTTTFSSGHDFEVEMWDIEISAGGSYADSATKIGDTQSVTALSLKIYSIGQVGLDYTLAAGHLLFMPIRYTDGSGTFYTYGTLSMEFTNA